MATRPDLRFYLSLYGNVSSRTPSTSLDDAGTSFFSVTADDEKPALNSANRRGRVALASQGVPGSSKPLRHASSPVASS